jgi:uncharacterized membrane protein YeaQ/YmgE (transglycosylase-associated protein family)
VIVDLPACAPGTRVPRSGDDHDGAAQAVPREGGTRMIDIIGTIIFGAVIGALARLFMKGDQNLGILWTVILGVAGALVGQWLAGLFGVEDTDGIDWIRWIFSIVASIVFIAIYLGVTNKNRPARR